MTVGEELQQIEQETPDRVVCASEEEARPIRKDFRRFFRIECQELWLQNFAIILMLFFVVLEVVTCTIHTPPFLPAKQVHRPHPITSLEITLAVSGLVLLVLGIWLIKKSIVAWKIARDQFKAALPDCQAVLISPAMDKLADDAVVLLILKADKSWRLVRIDNLRVKEDWQFTALKAVWGEGNVTNDLGTFESIIRTFVASTDKAKPAE